MGADNATTENLSVTMRFFAVVKQQLGKALVAPIGDGATGSNPGEQALLDLDAFGFGLVFGEANPGHLGVGVGHARNHAGVEGGAGQVLVALQFASNNFSGHMRFVDRLVRQHGLANDVADGEDVRDVGAHLDIDVDEATVRDGNTGLFCRDLLAVGCAPDRLQHQIVGLRCRRRTTLLGRRECHLNALRRGLGTDGLGFQHDVVKAWRVHLLPDLHEVAIRALHQAVEHFDHVKPCTERAVNGAHLQTDDAAAQNQHALGHFLQRQCAGGIDDTRIVRHERQAYRLRTSGDDAVLERDGLRLAGFLLRRPRGFFHLNVVGTDKSAVAAHHRHLAHLGHGSQSAGEFAHHFFLVSTQLVNVDCGLSEVNAECCHVRHLVHHRRHMQQGLARDAAHIQADTAELRVTLYHNDLEPQVGGAKSRRVAAGTGTEHQQIAVEIGSPCEAGSSGSRYCSGWFSNWRCNGCSSRSFDFRN